jgi:hypothetical protein
VLWRSRARRRRAQAGSQRRTGERRSCHGALNRCRVMCGARRTGSWLENLACFLPPAHVQLRIAQPPALTRSSAHPSP